MTWRWRNLSTRRWLCSSAPWLKQAQFCRERPTQQRDTYTITLAGAGWVGESGRLRCRKKSSEIRGRGKERRLGLGSTCGGLGSGLLTDLTMTLAAFSLGHSFSPNIKGLGLEMSSIYLYCIFISFLFCYATDVTCNVQNKKCLIMYSI